MKLKKSNQKSVSLVLASSLFCATQAFGLEFGHMGNISASMGGAGVALKNSQWGLYYNPALLGASNKSRFAYSFGVAIRENNLIELSKVDFNNLASLPAQFSALFNGAVPFAANGGILGGAAPVPAANLAVGGYVGEVLGKLLPNGATEEGFKDLLNDVLTTSGVGAPQPPSDLQGTINAFKQVLNGNNGNAEKVFETLKGKLQDASQKAGGNALFDSLLGSLTPQNMSGLVELIGQANGGSLTPDQVLDKLGAMNLTLVGNPSLEKAMKDLAIIQEVLRRNNFSISSQDGLVLQLAPRGETGGFAMGLFASIFGNASASFDPTKNQIIVPNGAGNYLKLGIHDGGVSVSKTTQQDFNGKSMFSPTAKHHLITRGIAVVEIPVGYGHSFDVGAGEISIGGALKYIQGIGYDISQVGAFDTLTKIQFPNLPTVSQNIGIDLGFLYSIGDFSVGLVGKNLNNPSLKLSEDKRLYLNPQVRAGLGYKLGIFHLAFDADLLPNNTLAYAAPKSQMVGGGMMVDLRFMDLRIGAMYDVRNTFNDGLILTGGINLFGFFDIAVQSGLKLSNIGSVPLPSNFALKIGGGFSW